MKKHTFCYLLLIWGLSGCNAGVGSGNINLEKCSPSTLGGECLTTLDNLIPGQSNIGEYVINMKKDGTLAKFVKKCNDGKLDEDLFKRGSDYANLEDGGQIGISSPQGIAGVVAPDGKIMLFNGHHHTYALHKLAELVENEDPNTKKCKTKSKNNVCKDVAEELTIEAYNYINKRYDEFKGFPGYNYKAKPETYTCEVEK